MKVCARCKESKTIDCFSKNPQQKDGYHVYCKLCVSIYHKKYYQDHREEILEQESQRRLLNPDKNKEYHKSYRINFPERIRESRLIKTYGLTLKDWNDLFDKQNRCCAICFTADPGPKGWNTDHIHGTKIVRGILCQGCNQGIGMFKDSRDILVSASEYVSRNYINATPPEISEGSTCANLRPSR